MAAKVEMVHVIHNALVLCVTDPRMGGYLLHIISNV